MTSTSPYSDIKWNDIVPWVRDSIFKTTIDRHEKKTIEELENPNFIFDTEIKCDDLTRAFMVPLLMGNNLFPERWDARDYNLAAIKNNAKRISAEENYITGTLQETEYQPDKQEVTINNLFKGM